MSFGIAQASDAALIASDSFLRGETNTSAGDPALGQYDVRANINQFRRNNNIGAGQNPTVAGFTDAWTGNVVTGTSMAVAQWTAEFDGITSPSLIHPAGGRARFGGSSATNTLQRRVQRNLSTYTPSDTYYMSFISQVLTEEMAPTPLAGDPSGFVGLGFTNGGGSGSGDANFADGSTTMRGLLIGAAGNGTTTDYVVRHLGAPVAVGGTPVVRNDVILGSIPQNTPEGSPFTRFTVVKLEFNDDPANPAGNSKITIWQDPADITSESAAGAPQVFRTFALGTNADLSQLTLLGINFSRASSFDEPRLGTEWADVAPVPEPASLAALGLAAVALLGRRRRA
jgi:hypothetical protein